MSVSVSNSEFLVENTLPTAKITGVHDSLLQESEKDILWFRDNFICQEHQTYLCTDSPRGPMAVSLVLDKDTYKILVRTDQGSERLSIASRNIRIPWYKKVLGLLPSLADIMSSIDENFPCQTLRLCKENSIAKDLLAMEERQVKILLLHDMVIRSYKFGLVYVGSNQSTEEEMFQNRLENTSAKFQEFLTFIGEKIELKGWKGYRAGLDVNDNQTGQHSIYTKWQGYEIMFHVAPLLPYSATDKQQLEKKRHIGNDIVVILFQDSDTPFRISTITSKQNHVICVIKPQGEGYKMTIVHKNGVPAYTPELPDPTYFERNAVSRDFLLHKLVNGERACYKAPSFAPKISRTRSVLIKDVVEKGLASQ
ncbi:Rap GTPase activating proteins domain-containing protein [Rozella allomycis CSF55]|uniref:Rap GTPase activating proteins domain-containing protein n=1 Tax=Rozella allomycis (strain CSF55) TaxID=988480 RepID=A0A075B4D2_ROZAC|nr:Rap GTPase activating proteins domain-containing protein [Rozella allomycis CSF55]|eukprot:EPZ36240.1 Rap GTPase activating proteins domain-containing protein [Rozella allomycis CSF55]